MAHIAKFRLAALRLAVQAAVGVGRAGRRVIFSLLAVNVLAAVSVPGPVLGFEAFVAGPSLDPRPVHGKMLVRQQRLPLRMLQKRRHELLEHRALLQPFPVLREGRRVSHRRVRRQAPEPAAQQIVVDLLPPLPL